MTSPVHPIYAFGGQGSLLHIAVANGFPPETYTPMLRPLLAEYRAVSLPPRALWAAGPPPEKPGSWRSLADDLLAGIQQHDLRDIIAIGHSFGGVASLLAVLDAPERFRALILLDPTILPPSVMDMLIKARESGEESWPMGLAEGAVRRRSRFESAAAAYEYYKGKVLFADWPDETIRLYAESMTHPAKEGDGVELRWTGQWEAWYYRSFYPYTWRDIPRLRGLLPILAIRGGTTDTFMPEAATALREALPEMAYAEVPGHGHLFPQSAPGETSRIIHDWLRTLG